MKKTAIVFTAALGFLFFSAKAQSTQAQGNSTPGATAARTDNKGNWTPGTKPALKPRIKPVPHQLNLTLPNSSKTGASSTQAPVKTQPPTQQPTTK